MANDVLSGQVKRLVSGMADQEIQSGKEFHYDGGKLYGDEVGDLMLASTLCIAQDLSLRLGLGSFGYQFSLGVSEPMGFPLAMERVSHEKLFLEVAPFVVEVFDGEVTDCRADLARLFECAARLINPEFSLDADTNYGELAV